MSRMMNLAEWPKDQWWYCDARQAGEQQISEDRAAGRRGPVFASGDELLAALREVAAAGGAVDSSLGSVLGPDRLDLG